jgi:hypothetical protein
MGEVCTVRACVSVRACRRQKIAKKRDFIQQNVGPPKMFEDTVRAAQSAALCRTCPSSAGAYSVRRLSVTVSMVGRVCSRPPSRLCCRTSAP